MYFLHTTGIEQIQVYQTNFQCFSKTKHWVKQLCSFSRKFNLKINIKYILYIFFICFCMWNNFCYYSNFVLHSRLVSYFPHATEHPVLPITFEHYLIVKLQSVFERILANIHKDKKNERSLERFTSTEQE